MCIVFPLAFSFWAALRYFEPYLSYFGFSFRPKITWKKWSAMLLGPWLAASAIVGIAASAMAQNQTDARGRWALLGSQWCKSCPIAVDQPHLGSWLDVRLHPWGVGCWVCAETKVSNMCASYSVQNGLQKSIFLKHQRSKVHRSAVKVWVEERKLLWPEPICGSRLDLKWGCFGQAPVAASANQSTLQFGCFGYSCSVAVSASCSVAASANRSCSVVVSARDSMHHSMACTGV